MQLYYGSFYRLHHYFGLLKKYNVPQKNTSNSFVLLTHKIHHIMKKILIIVFMCTVLNTFAQIKTGTKSHQKSSTNAIALDPGIGPNIDSRIAICTAFPIIGGKVAATPISIPAPNNIPIALELYPTMGTYANIPKLNPIITGCSLLEFKDNILKIRIYHQLNKHDNNPIYAGAWLYNKSGNALNVGYIPEVVSNTNLEFTDINLKFYSLPTISESIEVMLLKNGKAIAKKRFKLAFQWKKATKMEINKMKKLDYGLILKNIHKKPKNTNKLTQNLPDLEIMAVKSFNNQMNTVDFTKSCNKPKKIIFISNVGQKASANFLVIIGYYKHISKTLSKYIAYKQVEQKSLLPGKQTYVNVILPNNIDNIDIKIKFINNNTRGEINLKNNVLTKKCKL